MGMGRGASEQARFIAAEVYPSDKRAGVIGMIVFAGTVGAVGGPLLLNRATELAASLGLHVNAGPYLAAAAFTTLALVLTFSLLRPDPMTVGRTLAGDLNSREENASTRTLRQIFSDGTVRLSVGSMVLGQLVMTLIMVINVSST